ncbi:MAG: hypothetical protein QOI94_2642, partial [Acidobacteriaceae bacterium]|nr:hypothetical protein [Acidobacteriaceae bacterium]
LDTGILLESEYRPAAFNLNMGAGW